MFIAHLPAGYITTHMIARRRANWRGLLAVGLLFSILPDFDLLWFYLIDNRQTAHHEYITHWPLFWVGVASIATVLAAVTKHPTARPYIAVALICVLVHMVLDSFAAEIYWLRPFSDAHLNAVDVPAKHNWWVLNFILHWTFAAELAICFVAGVVFWQDWETAPQ